MGFGEGLDRLVVGGEAEEVDGDDRLRFELAFAFDLQDGLLKFRGIDVVGARVDVCEDRGGADERDGLDRGEERERRGEDRVAGSDFEGHERHEQGVGAAGTRQRVLHSGIFRQLPFEFGDLRTEDVVTALQHAVDASVDFVADEVVLVLQVDERQHGRLLLGGCEKSFL